ncbi:hypothetical protein PU629_18645 [Pullulanibacillus sp. KACC 23026]|uniref:hypothetical protein n=1 Tax=Pullulanibacillus sp. KACC 23026 TaxID=3028315 RepID=UPI0023B09128|nr:hypothetical protein [Pullulanibacillus sp. KACC 23026]WEG12114.1 hypothetical protein PU629_18645 [Pullulanibacillus sp. KACC 23026]
MKKISKHKLLSFTLLIILILSFFEFHSPDIEAGDHWYGYPIPWLVFRKYGGMSFPIINLLADIALIFSALRIIKRLFINKKG